MADSRMFRESDERWSLEALGEGAEKVAADARMVQRARAVVGTLQLGRTDG